MSLLDKAKDALAPSTKIPKDVEEKLTRGRERLQQVAPQMRVNIKFANNEHYVSLGRERKLVQLDTVPASQGGEKPDHRVRLSRDLISPIIKGKISACTQRTPAYENFPNVPDQSAWAASQLARKVAAAGYGTWGGGMKRWNKKLLWNALVTKEGFIRPFWDSTIGPFVPVEGPEGEVLETVGMGDVNFRVYSGLEVGWEPGMDFEDSRWCYIEHTRPVEDVEKEKGYIGGKLKPDAQTSQIPNERKGKNLVMVTEFLERPCPEYPDGRRLIMAGGKLIFPEEKYPKQDHRGEVVDEPCLHRLSYEINDGSDRGSGLVEKLIESMRAYDQAGNKFLEWLQLTLTPQILAERGSFSDEEVLDDTPGAVKEYDLIAGGKAPEWINPPTIPQELERQQERSKQEMDWIAHEIEVGASNVESAKQAQALITQAALAWQDFVEDYAELQGRLMRDCLTLVQLHYTEEKLLKFRGRTGWDSIPDFRGADLRGQTEVTISSSSMEPRTKQSNEQRIMNIAQMFPGHFPPEVLISALEGGSAEKLIEGYEDDVANANWVIAMIRSGQFWNIPPRPVFPGEEAPEINSLTGNPEMEEFEFPPGSGETQFKPRMLTELPGWMPKPFENVAVFEAVLTTWMKTEDWRNLEPAGQRASMDVYDALQKIKARKAAEQAQIQAQIAEQQGERNATKPAGAKPMPSLPKLSE